MMSDFSKKPVIDRLLHVGTHLWCLSNYWGCFTKTENPLADMVTYAFPIFLLRCLLLLNELKLAFSRIIGLDVEEKAAEAANKVDDSAAKKKQKR